MPSLYRTPNTHSRKQKSSDHGPNMISNDLELTSKDNDKAVFKKVKSINNLKGGDPDDVNYGNGRYLIEQAFSSQ